jgi:hypothetical protein
VNEEDLVNSAGVASFHIAPVSASDAAQWRAPQLKAGQNLDWRGDTLVNVRAITSFILAVALMASAGGVYPAEQSGQGSPYTGPDTPVTTTA